MHWTVYCLDAPGTAEARSKVLASHVAYVASCPLPVLTAGPLLADDDKSPIGSLIVLEAANRPQVETFVRDAPFARVGVWDQIRINGFAPVARS